MKVKIDGIVSIPSCPFHDDDSIDWASLDRVIDFCVATNARGICLPAYGTEFYKLSDEERLKVTEVAIRRNADRLPFIAMCNHGSAKHAAEFAKKMEGYGATVIGFAVPRIFALSEDDILRYAARIGHAIGTTLFVQDFNPGGATVGAAFCKRLKEECPNFELIKLEEPLMAEKITAIREATNDEVGVLEGWGSLYMLELFEAGIIGTMPGAEITDALQKVWDLRKAGRTDEAFDVFSPLLPHINFGLESFEMFHWVEKPLLVERGAIACAHVRDATLTVDPVSRQYIEVLRRRMLEYIESLGLPVRPLD